MCGLTGPTDPASTMDRSDTTTLFIVFEYLKNVPHVLNGFGQGPIDYWETMIFDVGEAHRLGPSREVGSVSAELVDFRQVDEGSDASCEQSFYLLLRDARAPGVFTSEEERGSPVGVRDWAFEYRVNGGLELLLGKQGIEAALGRRKSGARQGGSGHFRLRLGRRSHWRPPPFIPAWTMALLQERGAFDPRDGIRSDPASGN